MPEASLNTISNQSTVRRAISIYLLCFVAVNACVWTWFVLHRHATGHHFPLGERIERFGDLLRFSSKFQYGKDHRMLDTEHLIGTLFPKNYPPFAAAIYLFLLQLCAPYALTVFLAIVFGGFGAACLLLWRKVRTRPAYTWHAGAAIFLTGLVGWGTLQVAMRGNIEGLLWIATAIGTTFYAQRRYRLAGAAFGIACCIKPYPVLWFALMARHRRFRGIASGLASAVLVTLASLELIDPNPVRAYHRISGADSFFNNYIVAFRPMEEMMGDHSLFQTMKTLARVVRNHGLHFSYLEYWEHANDPLAWKLYHAYLPLAATIGIITLYLVWNKPVLNQIFAIACITAVLPLVAGDYTLTVLLIPMGLFLIFLLQDVAQGNAFITLPQMLWFLLPSAWIMACNPLWVLHGVFKTLAILILLAASCSVPLPCAMFGEAKPQPDEVTTVVEASLTGRAA